MAEAIELKRPIGIPDIVGAGGGKSGGGGASTSAAGHEAPNTLRSDSFLRITELLSEGPIEGLATPNAPLQSVYFDQTPVQNANGTPNFLGITYDFRNGLPDQPILPGVSTAETTFQVGTQVIFNQGPIVHTIVDENVTSVRFVAEVPALAYQDQNGNLQAFATIWFYDVRPHNGDWQNAGMVNLVSQKCTSPVFFATVVDLPPGGAPWEIRMRRGGIDWWQVGSQYQDQTWWTSYTEIVGAKLSYPNSALAYLQVNAGQFSQTSVPARSYRIKGLIIDVPSNYDPVSRIYTGIWDGTFKQAWTDSPVWHFRNLIVNDRYGLGEFIDATKVDKWSLYQIAQYCDQLVPDGFGGSEPRYTLNTQIMNRQEAYKLLQSITTAWRGMGYWSLGQVFATADMPADPVKLVAPADVIDGHFKYSGTSLKTRHSVALITWSDPEDFYRPAVEVVLDEDQLQKFGWREVQIQAIGCTSRGMAHRYGKWVLDTEKNALETVDYTASWDHADVKPGDIISVADPRKANARIGGRIAAVTTTTVTLDGDFTPGSGETYSFIAEMPDKTLSTHAISSFSGRVVHLAIPYTTLPQVGAMWAITGTDVNPRQYRVLANRETAPNQFQITALQHDPTKYARVEQGINLAPPVYSRPPSVVKPPTNLQAVESLYFRNGVASSRIGLSWTPGDDFMSVSYAVSAQTPNGFQDYGMVNQPALDIDNTLTGDYVFYVTAYGIKNMASIPVSVNFTAKGWSGVDGPYVSHLEVTKGGVNNTFGGKDCRIDWQNNFPGSTFQVGQEPNGANSGAVNPLYRDNVVRIFDVDSDTLLRTDIVYDTFYTYTYENNKLDNAAFNRGPQRKFKVHVSIRDNLGRESAPAGITPENPVPDIIIPTCVTGVGQIFITYIPPTDLDFVGAIVWVSQDANFNPLTTAPAYTGINDALAITAPPFEYSYVRIAGYDQFGNFNLNVSPPVAVLVNGQVIDTTPPAVPTNLVLTSSVETSDSGKVSQVLAASWDNSPSDNFGYFDVQIARQGGGYISFQTNENSYQWKDLLANATYSVQVRAYSKQGWPSDFCLPATITMPKKTTAPGVPTQLAATASMKAVFLSWINPVDADIDHIDIWTATSDSLASAAQIGSSKGTAFTHSGLTTGTQLFYWVRAVNSSGVAGAFTASVNATPGQAASGDISAGAITADKIQAGAISTEHFNVNAKLPASILIGESGVSIGDLENPAGFINANSTLIDPGKIQVAGATTLASWRNGSDLTKIEGGSIAANTIAANKLTVGNRGITVTGLKFSYSANTLSWTAGSISYTNDAGTASTIAIVSGSAVWTAGIVYIAWLKDASSLSVGTTPFSDANFVSLASYTGGTGLYANYGQTQIDGANISTGTITAQQLSVSQLITDSVQINGGVITNTHLAGGITFDKMVGGTLTATSVVYIGGTHFYLQASTQSMVINDGTRNRVLIGGDGVGNYGLWVWDSSGAVVMAAGAITNVPLSAVNGQITAANASTYIASAAIGDAQIGTVSASKITVTQLSAFTANLGTVTAGVAQSADGKFVIDLSGGTLTISDSS